MGKRSLSRMRSELYHSLAEAVAGPSEWMALPGADWPLNDACFAIAPISPAARRAVQALTAVGAETMEDRRARYLSLSAGQDSPAVWFYESQALSGQLLGPEMLDVERWYQEAGLNIIGAELPDHASLELEFLAYLSGIEQGSSAALEEAFLRRHAGRWIPALGRALAASGDEVYAPVGRLMREWLEERLQELQILARRPVRIKRPPVHQRFLPEIRLKDQCTLCGFCIPACPSASLRITETAQETCLQLSARSCTGCRRCISACQTGALELREIPAGRQPAPGWVTLRASNRAVCRTCGEPLVSQAELDYVSAQLGQPAWLMLCMDCRSSYSIG